MLYVNGDETVHLVSQTRILCSVGSTRERILRRKRKPFTTEEFVRLALYGLIKGNSAFVQNSNESGSMNGKHFNARMINYIIEMNITWW